MLNYNKNKAYEALSILMRKRVNVDALYTALVMFKNADFYNARESIAERVLTTEEIAILTEFIGMCEEI